MNKNGVYKIIGYRGEYNASVKKALRKLLKENHPDNNGDRDKFELINEIKKELENGKSLYINKDILDNNENIDYDYYYRMINELNIKKNNLGKSINIQKELLKKYENEYKDLYQNSLNLENHILVNSSYIKKIQNNKICSIIILILMIVVFIVSIIKNSNLLFIIFIVLSMLCIYFVQKHLLFVHKMTESNKKRFASYVKLNNRIRKNIRKQNNLKKEIRDTKRKMVNTENDLRFYKNLLK